MTYEQRMQKLQKAHADRYNAGGRREYAGGPLLRNDPEHMRDEAEVTIDAQAEVARELLSHLPYTSIEFYLKVNGYVPGPGLDLCSVCGGEYKTFNCASFCTGCGRARN